MGPIEFCINMSKTCIGLRRECRVRVKLKQYSNVFVGLFLQFGTDLLSRSIGLFAPAEERFHTAEQASFGSRRVGRGSSQIEP